MKAAALLALLVLWLGAAAGPAAARTPQPVLEPARDGPCIEGPARMRRNHAALLVHQRVATVRAGERSGKASLVQCVECHASRETGSVAARREDFCMSCHAYAGVKLDCFECHTPKAARR
jgi:hypothetical protein